jgi:hypothetical protein
LYDKDGIIIDYSTANPGNQGDEPMINKEKTILKAVSKYHSLLPIHGRNSIEDCFFCVRGDYFFLFKTMDKKRHIIKAEVSGPDLASLYFNREFLNAIYKALNKPILVRSLFLKNADVSLPAILTAQVNRDLLFSIYKTLNKPIRFRSPFTNN